MFTFLHDWGAYVACGLAALAAVWAEVRYRYAEKKAADEVMEAHERMDALILQQKAIAKQQAEAEAKRLSDVEALRELIGKPPVGQPPVSKPR